MKHLVHFRLRFEILLFGVSHTVRVFVVGTCTDAEQYVVRFGVVSFLEVNVVGANEFHTLSLCHRNEHLVHFFLKLEGLAVSNRVWVFHLVALEFKVEVVAKHFVVPSARLFCSSNITSQNLLRNFATNTCRAHNKVFMVFRQILTVGAGAVVETIYPCPTHKFDEVFVTVVILCQHHQVIVALGLVFFFAVSHIHFATKNGLERLKAFFFARFIDFRAVV